MAEYNVGRPLTADEILRISSAMNAYTNEQNAMLRGVSALTGVTAGTLSSGAGFDTSLRSFSKANDEEIVVRDYKTTSRKINSEELRNEYKLDTQTYAYLTLAAAKWELIPNRMEYTFLKTPSYSFARKKVGTTNLDWLEKVKQAIEKTPSEWFTTIKLNVSAQNLQQWRKEQLIPMLDEVRDWWRSGCPGFPYNEQSLRTKFNSKCTMYDLIVFGQTSNYHKRTKAFSEYVV